MGAHPRRARTLAVVAVLANLLASLPACTDAPNPSFRPGDGGQATDNRVDAGSGGAVGAGGTSATGGTGTGGAGSGGAGTGGAAGNTLADAGGDTVTAVQDAAGDTSSLIGYWRLDDDRQSTMAVDSSGRGNHGTLVSLDAATVWTAGTVGTGALSLTGTPGSGVRIPWSKQIDDLRAFTIAAWITRVITPVHKAVFSRQLNATDSELFTISAQNNEIIVYIPGTGSQMNREVRAATSVPASTWMHVASTYDGSTFRLYLNGSRVVEKTMFTNRLLSAPNDVYIGNNFNAAQNEPYQGSIDEVVLFSRALTADKIAALANRTSPLGLD